MARTVTLQRRAVGKRKWKSIRTTSTTAAGAYAAVLNAPVGSWQFRLRVKAGAGAARRVPRRGGWS